jgi:transcriptional regulator with XRE-family HTH domain
VAEVVRGIVAGRPQRELADLLGIDQSGVSRALAGKRAFNLREITLIAAWSGREPEDILFTEPSAFAFRCEDEAADCDAAAQRCRAVVQDFLAFRAVAE